jgi:signal transduction histidine kinase
VYCDRDRVLQILSNLIGNAFKFTPGTGAIAVRIERLDGEVRFTVSDNGSGIPEEQFAHIWERFWQGRKTSEGGVGLGLSIAKGLVEAHGGRIWGESKVGVGTTFCFTLPLAGAELALSQPG